MLLNNTSKIEQMAIRMKNLIATYGAKDVFTHLESFIEAETTKYFFDTDNYPVDRNNTQLMLMINIAQVIRYFGAGFVKEYVAKVHDKKNFAKTKGAV